MCNLLWNYYTLKKVHKQDHGGRGEFPEKLKGNKIALRVCDAIAIVNTRARRKEKLTLLHIKRMDIDKIIASSGKGENRQEQKDNNKKEVFNHFLPF